MALLENNHYYIHVQGERGNRSWLRDHFYYIGIETNQMTQATQEVFVCRHCSTDPKYLLKQDKAFCNKATAHLKWFHGVHKCNEVCVEQDLVVLSESSAVTPCGGAVVIPTTFPVASFPGVALPHTVSYQ